MGKYETKIKKELDKYSQQWEDACCPSVTKYGRQADKEIAELRNTLVFCTRNGEVCYDVGEGLYYVWDETYSHVVFESPDIDETWNAFEDYVKELEKESEEINKKTA